MNPDGSGLEELRTIGNNQIDFLPFLVSPDGTNVAMQDIATAPDRLVVIPASGAGDPVALLDPVSGYLGSGKTAHASWSPDGAALAIAGNDLDFTRLFIVNADGSELSAVPGIEEASDPAWRPE